MEHTRTKKFDAFGPWIYEIDSEHELPPLFSQYKHLQGRSLIRKSK